MVVKNPKVISKVKFEISSESKLLAAFAYLGQLLFGFLSFILTPFIIFGFLVPLGVWLLKKNEDEYVAFHAKQALVYSIIEIIITVILGISFLISFLISFILIIYNPIFLVLVIIIGLIFIIFSVISLAYFVLGIINCFSGEKKHLPLIGWIGEKF